MATEEEENIDRVINGGASEIQLDGQTAKFMPLSDLERIERRIKDDIRGFSKRPKCSSMGATLRNQS
tara:strand:+ start:64 stop:264 length:201 start_codon:yes stop_codon:yes gene_type:complete